MERLRILAAAAALHDFTIPKIVAYSGANENTVRSVLQRESTLFQVVPDSGARQRTGRPSNRYRVADAEGIRVQVALERGLAQPALEDGFERELHEDRLASIVVAEDAVLRAWDAETPDEQQLLAETALESLSQARVDAQKQPETRDALDRRAGCVSVFAELTQTKARGQPLGWERLMRGAEAITNIAAVAPPERVCAFLGGLTDAAIRSNELPPLGLIIEEDATPSDAIPELAQRLDGWISCSLPDIGKTLWAQRWAEPLLDRSLFTGVVIHDSGDDEKQFNKSLAQLSRWHVPAVVVSRSNSMDVAARVAAAGAYFVPVSHVTSILTETLFNAFGHGRLVHSFGSLVQAGSIVGHSGLVHSFGGTVQAGIVGRRRR